MLDFCVSLPYNTYIQFIVFHAERKQAVLQATFQALEIEQALSVFMRALNLSNRDDVTVMVRGATATVIFESDKELQEVRAWGQGARACQLVESFSEDVLV